jgi:hypothetical protein
MTAALLKLALSGLNIGKALLALLKRFFGSLNAQGWIGLVVSVALALGWIGAAGDARHYKKQSDRYERLYRDEKAAVDEADRAAREAQATANQISKELKERNDAENRRIADTADAIRVSGPGKAACRANPTRTGGHDKAGGSGDATGSQVPADDRAAVPWPWLVAKAEQADLNRAEVLTWREWYKRLVAAWPKGK